MYAKTIITIIYLILDNITTEKTPGTSSNSSVVECIPSTYCVRCITHRELIRDGGDPWKPTHSESYTLSCWGCWGPDITPQPGTCRFDFKGPVAVFGEIILFASIAIISLRCTKWYLDRRKNQESPDNEPLIS